MNWGNPIWFHGLWALPLLILVLWGEAHQRKKRFHRLGVASAFRHRPRIHPGKVFFKALLTLLGLVLVLTALARPRWGFSWEPVRQRNLDIMVLLDTSKSMLATDFKPNRLQRAKWGLQDLIEELKGERIGLVAFAGSSFLLCPLTSDYAAFRLMLEDVYAGIIPRGGTEIAQALRTALRSFDTEGESEKVILLLTDGEDHATQDDALINTLKKEGIKVYSVGIGTRDGELIPVKDDQGNMRFLTNAEGNVVKSTLNESYLETLSLATGGSYVRSTAGDSGLEALYQHSLGTLSDSREKDRVMKRYHERFYLFLGLGLGCLLIEAFLSPYQRRRNHPDA